MNKQIQRCEQLFETVVGKAFHSIKTKGKNHKSKHIDPTLQMKKSYQQKCPNGEFLFNGELPCMGSFCVWAQNFHLGWWKVQMDAGDGCTTIWTCLMPMNCILQKG